MVDLTIIYRIGRTVTVKADEDKAKKLISYFYKNMSDPDATMGVDLRKGKVSVCRLRAVDISGMIIQ